MNGIAALRNTLHLVRYDMLPDTQTDEDPVAEGNLKNQTNLRRLDN